VFNHPDVLQQLVADRHRQARYQAEANRLVRENRRVKRAARHAGR
jgi:hypothetical protein